MQVKLIVVWLLLPVVASPAETHATRDLTAAGARLVAVAARDYASEHHAPGGVIAIVDSGGHLLYLERIDGTFAAASTVATGKARTAALFQKPTRLFEEIVNNGRTTMVTLDAVTGFTPLKGGVPLIVNGEVVGAIGVSGAASADQDDEIASAAAEALARAPIAGAVSYLGGDAVRDGLRRGTTLHQSRYYKIDASRRDRPGEAEVHDGDTDIFHVLDGQATLVTGGRLAGSIRVEGDEQRSPRIDGGDKRMLGEGDVVVIPAGTPHWFSDVTNPVTYLVVKIRQ
jgi:glc operon protein GlcG